MDTTDHHAREESPARPIPPNPHFCIWRESRPKVTAEQAYAQMEASAGNMGKDSPLVMGWPGGPSKTAAQAQDRTLPGDGG